MIVLQIATGAAILIGSLISSLIGAGASAISGGINRKAQQDASNAQLKAQNEAAANEARINLQNQLNTNDMVDAYKARVDNLFARCGGSKKLACGGKGIRKMNGGTAKYYDRKSIYNLINRH